MKACRRLFRDFVLAGLLTVTAGTCAAVVMDFEGVAPPGGGVLVTTANPYVEDGFTLIPSNIHSGVLDPAAPTTMLGNNSAWFFFQSDNYPQLRRTDGGPFSLDSLLIGPTSGAGGTPAAISISASVYGGGPPLGAFFNNLNTTTLTVLNWDNVDNVTFVATKNAGLDNIVLGVPEPATLALLGLGLAGLAATRRRKQ